MKETILKSAITGIVIGAFLFAGLGLFADRVIEDHSKMAESLRLAEVQVADQGRKLNELHALLTKLSNENASQSALIRAGQETLNARVIEMRHMK